MAHHARLYYGLPAWLPLVPATIAVAEWRAGFDADDVSAIEAARRTHAALLLIVDGDDPRMPEAVVRRVFDAHAGPKALWTAPGAPHAGAGERSRLLGDGARLPGGPGTLRRAAAHRQPATGGAVANR